MTQNSSLSNISKRNESTCLQKALHTNIFTIFIDNRQKLETAQVSIKRMDKQNVIHSYSGIILSNTEEQITDTLNITMSKISLTQMSSYYTILLTEVQWKQAKLIYGNRNQMNNYFLQGITGKEHKGTLQGNENILYLVVVQSICHN